MRLFSRKQTSKQTSSDFDSAASGKEAMASVSQFVQCYFPKDEAYTDRAPYETQIHEVAGKSISISFVQAPGYIGKDEDIRIDIVREGDHLCASRFHLESGTSTYSLSSQCKAPNNDAAPILEWLNEQFTNLGLEPHNSRCGARLDHDGPR